MFGGFPSEEPEVTFLIVEDDQNHKHDHGDGDIDVSHIEDREVDDLKINEIDHILLRQ